MKWCAREDPSLHMEWRKGYTVGDSGRIEAMEIVWRSPLAQHRIRLNRGDTGFGHEPIMAGHEQGKGKRPSFLFKLRLSANVKKAAVPWNVWQGKSNEGLLQLLMRKGMDENIHGLSELRRYAA